MKVYVSFVQDRHRDPEIKVFVCPDKAIEHTRNRFAEILARPEHIQEYKCASGWMLSLGYELASDYAFVVDTCLLGKLSQAALESLAKSYVFAGVG